MCKRHKRFVIFLDVDGVLNTTTTVQKTPDGYTGQTVLTSIFL